MVKSSFSMFLCQVNHFGLFVSKPYRVNVAGRISPVKGLVRPSLGFCCSISSLHTTCPYFDNLNFDIFDAGGLQCHIILSRLYCVLGDFHMSTDALVQNFLLVF